MVVKLAIMLASLAAPVYGPRMLCWPLPGLVEACIVDTPGGYRAGVWSPHGLFVF